ncbi:MAG TPA: MoaD/ThiS family protein [Stackebrandtia sp.]|jgi:molybdopterin converting factor small subunit|uniref:MoaD/ThiS family protein n=1 Tax=Stackebrandtia sp. TaxID=2023065 RepID=UPI002D69C4FA|nr:MoaD/ThiS family protein [Stackebrandtia sp.]HZE41993.1 MoaD/ThiS family protein [Stackebrandtia sp.]
MSVTVFIPGALRGEAEGAASLDVAVDAAATLTTVLDAVGLRYPRLDRRIRDEHGQVRRHVNVFVGEDECRRLSGVATAVPDGAEVRVLPSIAGG